MWLIGLVVVVALSLIQVPFADRFVVTFAIADVLLIPRSRLLKLLKGGGES